MENKTYKNFNFWDPSIYVKYGKPQFELINKVLDKVLRQYPLRGNENILDIGCGAGNITMQLAQSVPRGKVVGIDQSSNMINFARKAFGDIINLSFEEHSADNFSLNQKFDIIVCFNTFHLVVNQIEALNIINEHLTDNGLFLVIMPRPQVEIEPITEVIISVLSESRWQPYFTDFAVPDYLIEIPKIQYRQTLVDAGFKINYFSEIDNFIKFPTKEEYANWIETWLPHRLAIPVELRKPFFLHIVDEYCKFMKQSDDDIGFHYVVWEFLIQKQ